MSESNVQSLFTRTVGYISEAFVEPFIDIKVACFFTDIIFRPEGQIPYLLQYKKASSIFKCIDTIFSLFIYIVFPNEEYKEVFLFTRKPLHISQIHHIFYIFLRTVFSTNRSRNVRKQYNHQSRENTVIEPESYIFLRSLYFSAVRSTVQLSLGTAGMRYSGHITMVYKFLF
jgi:hypothetical protein